MIESERRRDINIIVYLSLTFFILDVLTQGHIYDEEVIYKGMMNYNIPEKMNGIMLILIHHIINTVIHIIAFLPTFRQYAGVCVSIVLVHWYLNNWKCYLTQLTNDIYGTRDVYFRDFWYMIGLKFCPYYLPVYYTIMFLVLVGAYIF